MSNNEAPSVGSAAELENQEAVSPHCAGRLRVLGFRVEGLELSDSFRISPNQQRMFTVC